MNTIRIGTGKLASGAAITALVLLGGAGIAFAQTSISPSNSNTTGYTSPSTDTTGSTGTMSATSTTGSAGMVTTPGIPNTGAGGNAAANIMTLVVSAIIAVGGATYLTRERSAAH